jgi:uncharacterized protein YkwD
MSLTASPKRPTHHKKMTGEHHRRSKHYLKTYHPYLPLLMLVLVGLAINLFWTSRTSVLGASTNMTSSELLADTNFTRQQNNEDSLALDNKLSAAAQAKANDMAAKNYWAHTSPTGQTPWKFIQNSGYDYFKAGENLAYGFRGPSDTIDGWMNSAEHRANLLSPDFTQVGFGIAPVKQYQGHGPTTIVVAMYGEPSVMSGASDTASVISDIPLRNVARVQLLTHGQAPWSLLLVSCISLLAAAWFLWRHSKAWHASWRLGEEFVIEHKLLDVVIVAIAVAGFVLTRSAGFIH